METEQKTAVECLCNRLGVGKVMFENRADYEYPVGFFDEKTAYYIVKGNPLGFRIGKCKTVSAPIEVKKVVKRGRKPQRKT